MTNLDKAAIHATNASGVFIFGGTLLNYLPTVISIVGGILACAWYVLQFYVYFKNKKGD